MVNSLNTYMFIFNIDAFISSNPLIFSYFERNYIAIFLVTTINSLNMYTFVSSNPLIFSYFEINYICYCEDPEGYG